MPDPVRGSRNKAFTPGVAGTWSGHPDAPPAQVLCKLAGIQMLIVTIIMDLAAGATQ